MTLTQASVQLARSSDLISPNSCPQVPSLRFPKTERQAGELLSPAPGMVSEGFDNTGQSSPSACMQPIEGLRGRWTGSAAAVAPTNPSTRLAARSGQNREPESVAGHLQGPPSLTFNDRRNGCWSRAVPPARRRHLLGWLHKPDWLGLVSNPACAVAELATQFVEQDLASRLPGRRYSAQCPHLPCPHLPCSSWSLVPYCGPAAA